MATPTIDPAAAHAQPDFLDGTQACAGRDHNAFFPDSSAIKAAKPAIRICRQCPLRTPCGTWAINTRQEFGIWGGLTPLQRRQIRRKNGAR
jgi:WhiB family transcriptional regulator, redox-sensing transcriptional regulator